MSDHDLASPLARIALALLVVLILFDAPALAVLDACKVNGIRVAQHGPSIEDLNEPPPAVAASVTEEELLTIYRFPYPERVVDHAVSFWDLLPGGFFVALGRSRDEVERLTLAEWIERMDHFMMLRGFAKRHGFRRELTRSYLSIDWLYSMAVVREEFGLDEFVRGGGVEGFVIPKESPWNSVRYTGRDDMQQGKMWMMVAGLYAWEHLAFQGLADEFENEYHVPSGYWQRFPPPSQPWNTTTERRRVREYLCSEPTMQYLIYRAETFAAAAESGTQHVGTRELADLGEFIESNLADFDEFVALMAPGTSARARMLELIRNYELRDRMRHTLETQGAAKSYMALREKALLAADRYGDSTSVVAIWEHLAPHEKFLWPDRCMHAFQYPVTMVVGTPRFLSGAYDLLCEAYSYTRDELYDMYRPRP